MKSDSPIYTCPLPYSSLEYIIKTYLYKVNDKKWCCENVPGQGVAHPVRQPIQRSAGHGEYSPQVQNTADRPDLAYLLDIQITCNLSEIFFTDTIFNH